MQTLHGQYVQKVLVVGGVQNTGVRIQNTGEAFNGETQEVERRGDSRNVEYQPAQARGSKSSRCFRQPLTPMPEISH